MSCFLQSARTTLPSGSRWLSSGSLLRHGRQMSKLQVLSPNETLSNTITIIPQKSQVSDSLLKLLTTNSWPMGHCLRLQGSGRHLTQNITSSGPTSRSTQQSTHTALQTCFSLQTQQLMLRVVWKKVPEEKMERQLRSLRQISRWPSPHLKFCLQFSCCLCCSVMKGQVCKCCSKWERVGRGRVQWRGSQGQRNSQLQSGQGSTWKPSQVQRAGHLLCWLRMRLTQGRQMGLRQGPLHCMRSADVSQQIMHCGVEGHSQSCRTCLFSMKGLYILYLMDSIIGHSQATPQQYSWLS